MYATISVLTLFFVIPNLGAGVAFLNKGTRTDAQGHWLGSPIDTETGGV